MKPKTILMIMLVLSMVLVATLAFAQDDEPTVKKQKNIIQKGGVIGIVILILSIIGVALVIEHFVSLRRDKLAPPDLVNELEMLLQEEEYDEALQLCDAERNPLTNIISAGLPKLASGYEAMAKAISEANDEEALKLHQKISYISLIANTSPMLGLLGTVSGMVAAFNVIAAIDNPKVSELADGISTALVTTLFGLVVAIPMLAFYSFFKNKVSRIILDIGNIAEELVERFRPVQEV
ncbi:MotA/TolQ/ExbB proton channel family protein [Planctomycetota bacterium]